MKHKPNCPMNDLAEIEKARNVWKNKWPNHCKECEGKGGFDGFENGAPHGEGYWAMPVHDPCGCVDDLEVCPRCGSQMGFELINNEWPCPTCLWNWGKDKDDWLPELPECYCWVCFDEGER